MKKAISLVSLVIVIVVMIILCGTVIITSNNSVKLTNKTMFANEILNIQTLVDEYYSNNGTYPAGSVKSFNYTTLDTKSQEQFSLETSNTFYEVSLADIGLSNVEYGNKGTENDVYVLSKTTGKVYYLEGVEFEDNIYYTVAEDLYNNNVFVKSNGKNEIKRYDVLFSLSDINKTHEPVIVKVKLPKNATINSVTATNNKSVSTEAITGDYKIVTVNESSENKSGNYNITVDYTYKDVKKVAKYSVTNYVEEFAINLSETIEEEIVYVTVEITNNNIQEVKYETKEITDLDYFKNYGRRAKNNTFKLDKGTKYTVYVKDEAGNTKMLSKVAGQQ